VVTKYLRKSGFFAHNTALFRRILRQIGLKIDAASQFQAPRPGAFRRLQRGDRAERRGIYLHVWWLIVPVIENIGRFKAELELAPL
jgi:hypothetical protein